MAILAQAGRFTNLIPKPPKLPASDLPYDPILLLHCCGTLAWILALVPGLATRGAIQNNLLIIFISVFIYFFYIIYLGIYVPTGNSSW